MDLTNLTNLSDTRLSEIRTALDAEIARRKEPPPADDLGEDEDRLTQEDRIRESLEMSGGYRL